MSFLKVVVDYSFCPSIVLFFLVLLCLSLFFAIMITSKRKVFIGYYMVLTTKVYLIVVSQIFVVNGRTVDKITTEQISAASSYSQCNKEIKSRKQSYRESKKSKKKLYSYSYKKISCKSKTLKLNDVDVLKETFSIKW